MVVEFKKNCVWGGGGGRVGLWFGTDVNERLDENGKRGGGRVDVNKKVKFCEN